MKIWRISAVVVLFTSLASCVEATQYIARELPISGPNGASIAYSINNYNQIVGSSGTSTSIDTPTHWNGYMMQTLKCYPGSTAISINDLGEIVGTVGNGYTSAVLWRNGIPSYFEHSSFADINDHGQMVGIYTDYGRGFAAIWNNGNMTPLDVYHSIAYALNNNGAVVGTHYGGAVMWTNGSCVELGSLSVSNITRPTDINDLGQIVGYSAALPYGQEHAFLWENGVMTDLKTLGGSYSYAYGINNRGQVVGKADTANGEQHACLWQNGEMIDLGSLYGGNSYAYSINDNGYIVGATWSSQASSWRAVIWEPVPEPTTAITLAIGVLGTCWRRKH